MSYIMVREGLELGKFLKFTGLFLVILLAPLAIRADHHEPHSHDGQAVEAEGHGHDAAHGAEEKVDAIAHIQDSHVWHFATVDGHHYQISLPVILYSADRGLEIFSAGNFHGGAVHMHDGHECTEYNGYLMDSHGAKVLPVDESRSVLDFSITKNVASLFISVIIMFLVFFAVKKGYKKNAGKAPKGIQSFFEPLIVFIRDDIAKGNIGPKYQKYMPYLLTIFFFIWFNNLLGLMPGAANLTGNIAVTLILATFTLIITLASGNSTYWSHKLNPLGSSMSAIAKAPIYLILVPIELVGILTKPFSLMIRLFANISAGHIIILSILGLTFMAKSYATGIPLGIASSLFAVVMNMLELFVAILQAYIFTLLSAMYFGEAVEEHH